MPRPTRSQMELSYRLFDTFALNDQRAFYSRALRRYRDSANQVNMIRAFFSLLAGLASALAGLLVTNICTGGQCATPTQTIDNLTRAGIIGPVGVLLVLTIISPALAGAFGTLADLYQWDRLITIYESALENIEVADSRSPDPEMDDDTFWYSLQAYTDGTLTVMRDETAQWGQLIRTPEQLEKFVKEAKERADSIEVDFLNRSRETNTGRTTSGQITPISDDTTVG